MALTVNVGLLHFSKLIELIIYKVKEIYSKAAEANTILTANVLLLILFHTRGGPYYSKTFAATIKIF